eukprot:CAMPEP_0116930386 /NCGR_PEP_ID=MMETSP0467-20121206/27167_1 /TAXON_ID=283647 /ORGANISM="Mesodinium pulex, Strain SPMC105" /LENGTH=211 /DNA_ID=CAMNT_0004610579 /DNA_START=393 /DNA_END=1026 /DNA_ORIENTATION=-
MTKHKQSFRSRLEQVCYFQATKSQFPSSSYTGPEHSVVAAIQRHHVGIDVPSHSFRAGRGGETAALGLETAGAGVDEVARRESSQLGVESSAEQIIHTRCGGAPCEIHELALYRLGSRTALENKMDLCLHVLTVDYVFRHCVHVHLEVCLDYRVYSQSRAVGGAVEFDAMGLHLLLGGTPAEVECDGLGGGSGARGSHDVDGRLCVLVAVW